MTATHRADSPTEIIPNLFLFAPPKTSAGGGRRWQSEVFVDLFELSEKLDRLDALGYTDIRILKDDPAITLYWR